MKICAIVLSAGRSKRFKSTLPKYLHSIAGQSILDYNLNAIRSIKKINKIQVISNKENKKFFNEKGINPFIQSPIDGTGGALKQIYNAKKLNSDYYLVILSDTPIFDYKILSQFINKSISSKTDLSVLSQETTNPYGYGRIIIQDKKFLSIVEENDCNINQKKIKLINTGVFFLSKKTISKINLIKKNSIKKEFYITDLIKVCHQKKLKINTYQNRGIPVQGVNTKTELQELDNFYQNHLKQKLIQNGTRIIHPDTVYIENNVNISAGVIIEPNVVIKKNVKIGPNTTIKSFSYIEDCIVGNNCQIGPFARIRPETKISNNAKIGNFVEIKKSSISEGVKINHLSYVGDSQIGKNTNIGAGTITCNYDGKSKLSCKIGDNCFIGSNTSIVAPVKIGNNAYIAAGSVITKNVLNNQFSISRPKQKNIKKKIR